MVEGFTKFDNCLLERIYQSNLNASELKVILFIIRQTVGFNHNFRELSANYISSGVNLPLRSVKRTLSGLISKKILFKSGTSNNTNLIGINPDFSGWGVSKLTPCQIGHGDENDTATSDEIDTGVVSPVTPNKRKSLNKELKEINNISTSVDKRTVFDYQSVVDVFNTICISLPKVTKLTNDRKQRIKAADKQIEGKWRELFETVENSDFLTGRNGNWNGCSFDWILKPSNLIKIIEGNYDNKSKNSGTSVPTLAEYMEDF
ncbi:MAG: replication protein [Clostridia bacterium]|nr:replication protein [Clostridia bacterium]